MRQEAFEYRNSYVVHNIVVPMIFTALDKGIEVGNTVDFNIPDIARDERHAAYLSRCGKQIVYGMIGIDHAHTTPFFDDFFADGNNAVAIIDPDGVKSTFQTLGAVSGLPGVFVQYPCGFPRR